MKIIKTKRFENGRFNYSIKYKQFQTKEHDTKTGETSMILCHAEEVKFYKFPFKFGKIVQFGKCEDTSDYYRS